MTEVEQLLVFSFKGTDVITFDEWKYFLNEGWLCYRFYKPGELHLAGNYPFSMTEEGVAQMKYLKKKYRRAKYGWRP